MLGGRARLGSAPAAAASRFIPFKFKQPSFPGSIAVVQGAPVQSSSQGVTTTLYFRDAKDMAQAYGEETGKMMSYLHERVRPAAACHPHGGRNRGRRAQRLRRAGTDLSFAARHRKAGESAAAGEPDLAPVVGRAGLAGHAQSSVADQRRRRTAELLYLEHMNGAGALENRSRAIHTWKR